MSFVRVTIVWFLIAHFRQITSQNVRFFLSNSSNGFKCKFSCLI